MIWGNKNRDGRYLIVAADDLGRSSSVNMAVAASYDRGIVTASSIMTGGEAFEEARKRLSSLGLELVGYRELTKERTALDSVWEGI